MRWKCQGGRFHDSDGISKRLCQTLGRPHGVSGREDNIVIVGRDSALGGTICSMSEEMNYSANPGKHLVRTVDGVDYLRIPIKTSW